MAYEYGHDYPGLTQTAYDYLMSLNIDALSTYLTQNLTKCDDNPFYLFNDDADTDFLLVLLGDNDIDDSLYGITWFTYLKSSWGMGGF